MSLQLEKPPLQQPLENQPSSIGGDHGAVTLRRVNNPELAGIALAHHATLATSNTAHFELSGPGGT